MICCTRSSGLSGRRGGGAPAIQRVRTGPGFRAMCASGPRQRLRDTRPRPRTRPGGELGSWSALTPATVARGVLPGPLVDDLGVHGDRQGGASGQRPTVAATDESTPGCARSPRVCYSDAEGSDRAAAGAIAPTTAAVGRWRTDAGAVLPASHLRLRDGGADTPRRAATCCIPYGSDLALLTAPTVQKHCVRMAARTQRSVPPSVVATVMVLQGLEGLRTGRRADEPMFPRRRGGSRRIG